METKLQVVIDEIVAVDFGNNYNLDGILDRIEKGLLKDFPFLSQTSITDMRNHN